MNTLQKQQAMLLDDADDADTWDVSPAESNLAQALHADAAHLLEHVGATLTKLRTSQDAKEETERTLEKVRARLNRT